MKRSVLTSVSAFVISLGSAYGADLPSYKTPEPAPISWTGFYAGLNAGYGWGATTSVTTTAYPISDQSAAFFGGLAGTDQGYGEGSDYIYDYISASKLSTNYSFGTFALAHAGIANVNKTGFIGGGQLGYNWQFPLGGLGAVVGLEADFQGSTFSGSGQFSGAAADGFAVNGLFSATGNNKSGLCS